MRKRRIIAISAVALLGLGLVVFSMMRDTGPPVKVNGNFSAKDVAEIKSTVKRELWREALPNLSWKAIKAFPLGAKNALRTHLVSIDFGVETDENNRKLAITILSDGTVLMITYGSSGWTRPEPRTGWTSYSPLPNTNGH